MPDLALRSRPPALIEAAEIGTPPETGRRWLQSPLLVYYLAGIYVLEYMGFHFLRRLLLVYPLIALILAWSHWRHYRPNWRPALPLTFIAFLVWCALSYAWSGDPHDTAHQVLEYVAVALTGVIAGVVLERRDLVEAFSLGSKAFITITTASLIVAYHAATAPPALDPAPGWHGPVGGKNILGFLMAIAVITLATQRPWRRFQAAWLAVAGILLLGSQSGAGLSITLIVLAVMLWREALRGLTTVINRVFYKALSVILVIGGLIFAVLDLPAATSLLGKNATFTGRTKIWAAVISAIPHRLWSGYAFAGVWYNTTGETARLWNAIGFQAYEGHDSYLDLLLQVGVIGFVLLMASVVLYGRRLFGLVTSRDSTAVWFPLVLLAMLIEGLVESELLSNEVMILAVVLAAAVQSPSSEQLTIPARLGRRRRPSWTSRLRRFTRVSRRDIGWGTAFQGVMSASSAFLFFVLARDLGPTRFGYYAAVVGVTGLIGILVNSWVGMVITERTIREGQPLESALASVVTWLLIVGSITLAVVTGIAHALIPYVSTATTLVFMGGTVVGTSMVIVAAGALQSTEGYGTAVQLPLVSQIMFFLAVLGLWLADHVTLMNVGLSFLGSSLAVGVWSLHRASRVTAVRIRPGRPNRSDLSLGSVYAATQLSMMIEEDIDKPMLVHFGFAAAAGLYSAAYNVVTLGNVPVDVMTGATHNEFLEHDPDAIGVHRRRALRYTVIAGSYGVVAGIALWVAAPLLPIILGHAYQGTTQMIRWLALLVFIRSLSVYPMNGLMGLGRRPWRFMVLGITAAVNVVLNVILIPLLSWKGSAIATGAGEICLVSLAWIGLLKYQAAHDRAVISRSVQAREPMAPVG